MNNTPKTTESLEQEIAHLRQQVNALSAEIAQKDTTLGKNEARYQMLFDNAPDAMFIADADTGILVDANVAAEKLLQKSRDEIIGMHQTELHPPARKNYARETFNLNKQRQDDAPWVVHDACVLRTDGTKVPVEVVSTGLNINGNPHLMGIFHDISKRKAMEDALRVSETLFRRLVEEAHDGITVVDESGKIVVFNRTQEKNMGRSAEEVIGMNAVDFQFSILSPERKTPEVYQYLKVAMTQILTTGEHPTLTGIHRYQFVDKNGDIHINQQSAFTIKTDKGYKLVSFDRDITEEVEAQTKIRVLSEAVAQSQNAIMITNNEGIIEYVNTGFETITGYTLADVQGQTPRVLKSSLQTAEYYEKLWKTILAGQVFNDYIINRKKDGTTYTENKTISPLKDDRGKITHFVSVGRDISKLAEVEEALVENRARYESATSAGKVGVWDWDAQNETFYIDPQLKAILGYKDSEIENNFEEWSKLIHPDDFGLVIGAMSRYQQSADERFEITHRMVHKDGSARWILARGSGLRNEKGEIYRIIGTSMDITELVKTRQAEKAQRLQAETMQEIALALVSHTEVDAVLEEIFTQAHKLVDFSTANIALVKGNLLQVVSATGYEKYGAHEFIMNLSHLLDDNPVVLQPTRTKKAITIPNVSQHLGWVRFEPTAWILSYMGIPIMLHDEVIGVLQIDSDQINAFTPEDADRLQPLAHAAAIALENARLYAQTQKSAETNRVLLKEVNHRVKNNLAALIGLLYIEKRAHPEFAEMMDNVINRVRSMATAHEMLSATKWEPISLSRLVEQVIRNIGESQPEGRYFAVEVTPSSVQVTATQANNIALIINELTTNVVKHARLAEDRNAHHHLRIGVDVREDGQNIILEFMDNGKGFSEAVLESGYANVGLDLVKNMVTGSLLGTIALSNHNGALIRIEFPTGIGE